MWCMQIFATYTLLYTLHLIASELVMLRVYAVYVVLNKKHIVVQQ